MQLQVGVRKGTRNSQRCERRTDGAEKYPFHPSSTDDKATDSDVVENTNLQTGRYIEQIRSPCPDRHGERFLQIVASARRDCGVHVVDSRREKCLGRILRVRKSSIVERPTVGRDRGRITWSSGELNDRSNRAARGRCGKVYRRGRDYLLFQEPGSRCRIGLKESQQLSSNFAHGARRWMGEVRLEIVTEPCKSIRARIGSIRP